MVTARGVQNPTRLDLVRRLEKAARKQDSKIWGRVALELSKVRKNRREVNLHKINLKTAKGDKIVVPGKVLGSGDIRHEVEVAAFNFSESAVKKIEKAGGKAVPLNELLKKNPDGSGLKIIG